MCKMKNVITRHVVMDVFHDQQPSHKSSHKKNNFWHHEHIQS